MLWIEENYGVTKTTCTTRHVEDDVKGGVIELSHCSSASQLFEFWFAKGESMR